LPDLLAAWGINDYKLRGFYLCSDDYTFIVMPSQKVGAIHELPLLFGLVIGIL
jgi:hypothetical protein